MKLIFLILLLIGFYFSYSIFAYLQICFLGNVFFKSFFLKLILLILLFVFLFSKRRITKNFFSNIILLYLVYSFISFLFLKRFEYKFDYWIFSFLSQQFWFFYIALFYLFLEKQSDLKIFLYIRRFLFIVFFLNFPIGFIQFITSKTILPVKSNDNYFETMSFLFGDSIRSFGLMTSPLDFGLLNAIIYFICLSDILFVRSSSYKKILKIIVLILSIIGIYISMTRNIYLLTLLGSLFLVALKIKNKLILILMPFVNFLTILIVFILGSFMSWSEGFYILQNSSLIMRLYEWFYFINLISKSSFTDKLVGIGIIQNSKLYVIDLPIDNVFLSIILYNGLIGLLIFLLIFFYLYYKLLNIIFYLLKKDTLMINHSLIIASGALLFAFLTFSSFNNYYPVIYIFFLVPLLSLKFDWRRM